MAAFHLVAPGGKLVYVGLFQGDIRFHDPRFHSHEMTIMASRNATARDFRHVMSCLETGAVDVANWITHQESFNHTVDVFPTWLEPDAGVIKAELCL